MNPAVIFDMDGVLVASGPAHLASWKMAAKKHGLNISDERFKATFGRPSRDIIRLLWGQNITDEKIEEIDGLKEKLYRDLVTGMVPLTIGTREVLTNLHSAGCKLAVATSGPRENVALVLEEKKLGPFFGAIVTGFDIHHGKPAPDCFLLAAEKLAAPPADCVVIEDAPVGIEAARRAKMKCIALVGTHPAERLLESQPDRIVNQLAEITPAAVHALLAA